MKILFVNPITTINGATLMLLYFLEWINKEHPEIEVDVLSVRGGNLEKEFDKVAINHYKAYKKRSFFQKLFRFILRNFGLIKLYSNALYDYELRSISKKNYDIIYNNTILNMSISKELKRYSQKSKLILHVHELQNMILEKSPNADQYFPHVDHFICASKAVESNLINNWHVTNSTVIYEMSNINKLKSSRILESRIIIGGAGGVTKRKGVDLFIETASHILKSNSVLDIQFQWLGNISKEDLDYYQQMLKKLKIDKSFKFLGEKADTSGFFKSISVFLMTSREDPFPLVCIEAGSNGIPILLFDRTTGTQEVIEDLEYLRAPQFDTDSLANKTISLLKNKELYAETSKIMNERFSKFNVENQSQKIFEVINRIVN